MRLRARGRCVKVVTHLGAGRSGQIWLDMGRHAEIWVDVMRCGQMRTLEVLPHLGVRPLGMSAEDGRLDDALEM